jgi:putative endopeptidase
VKAAMNLMMKRLPLALAVAALLGACTTPPATESLSATHAAAAFDGPVRPQDDLFRAANGRWLETTPIPADKSSYGTTIALRDQADARVRAIVDELASREPRDGGERQLRDYYLSQLDTAAIDRAGLAPAAPWLARIDGLKTREDLAALFGELQGMAPLPLTLYVNADAKEPQRYALHLYQSGLGLPDRDYYLKDDERLLKARAAYQTYLRALLQAAGDAQVEANAQAVYAFEKRMAEVQWSRVENRDPIKRYNPMPLPEMQRRAPLPWQPWLTAAKVASPERVIVAQPSYVDAFAKIAADTPLPVWQAYLKVRVLAAGAEVLPKPLRDARFAYEDQALAGMAQEQPRWQVATRATNNALGEAVGKLYVQRHFPPAYKARMQQLVDNLMAAYRGSIDGLSWMGPETKQRAQAKLARYSTKIGYPEVWRDYSALQVKPGDAFGNRLRAGRFEWERRARQVGGPVDRREWHMTPQTVNAYYNPVANEIVFPAAILEPPFFDMKADDAYNYGAIGGVIGHEISHGFDDQGSRYDGDGRLANWWTEADRKAFDALAQKLVVQYDAYQPLPGQHVNGKLTLGENIADLSGLQIAYKAWQLSLKGKPAPVLDGLTGEQRFFAGWARAWRSKLREERLLQLLVADPHSPAEYRANGAVVNHDAFHQTFGTKPGDGMWKPVEERIRIW